MNGKDLQLLERIYDKGIGDEQNINPFLKEIFSDYHSLDPNDETDKKGVVYRFLLALKNNNLIDFRGDISLQETRDYTGALQTRLIDWEFVKVIASITYEGRKFVDSNKVQNSKTDERTETKRAFEIVMNDEGGWVLGVEPSNKTILTSVSKFLKHFFRRVLEFASKNESGFDEIEVLKANSVLILFSGTRLEISFLESPIARISYDEYHTNSLEDFENYQNILIKDSKFLYGQVYEMTAIGALNEYAIFETMVKTYLEHSKQKIQDRAMVKRLTERSSKPKEIEVNMVKPQQQGEYIKGMDKFQADYEGQRTAFLIMSFAESRLHNEIVEVIKTRLKEFGITGLRADDKEYNNNILDNIKVYMHCAEFGIAIFERLNTDNFNPNVSLEVGYMMGMGKEVCLLKDQNLANLTADLTGQLYKPFNPQEPESTIPQKLDKWLNDRVNAKLLGL